MPRISGKVSAQGRELIDAHFGEWQQFRSLVRPPRGWIRSIREALGMSAAVLAGPPPTSRR